MQVCLPIPVLAVIQAGLIPLCIIRRVAVSDPKSVVATQHGKSAFTPTGHTACHLGLFLSIRAPPVTPGHL